MNSDFEKAKAGFSEHLAVRNYSPTSRVQYERDLEFFFRFLEEAGVSSLKAVGRDTLKAYQLSWTQKQSSRGKPYAWGTRSTYFRVVRRLFDWLEKTRQIFLNPAQFIHDGKRMSRLPGRVLSEEELERVMAVPNIATRAGFRDRTIMEVFYSTGLRMAEMVALRLGDIDLVERVVRVNKGKGSKDRVVPIGEKACGYVRKYLEEIRPWFLRKKEEEPQALWMGRNGVPIGSALIQLNFRLYGKAAGLPDRTSAHAFRHAFATHLLRHGADIRAVSKMLGHSRLRVTQGYTHLAVVDVKKAHGETHPRERQEEAVATPENLRLYKCPENLEKVAEVTA